MKKTAVLLAIALIIFCLAFLGGCQDKGDDRIVADERIITVSFETSGGTAIEEMYLFKGNRLSKVDLEIPTKAKAYFVEWYTDNALQQIFAYDKLYGDITLYAKWVECTETLELSLKIDDEAIINKQDIQEARVAIKPNQNGRFEYSLEIVIKDSECERIKNIINANTWENLEIYFGTEFVRSLTIGSVTEIISVPIITRDFTQSDYLSLAEYAVKINNWLAGGAL